MRQAEAQILAIKKYGKHAVAVKPRTMYGGFYSCPFRVVVKDKIVGWGHSWKQALAGPCPHYKDDGRDKTLRITCVMVAPSPFTKRKP